MKTRIINIFRSVLISPEILSVIVWMTLYCYAPGFILEIGNWYKKNIDWIVGVGVNGGLLGFSLLQAKEVLFPVNNSMGILNKWEGYVLLKDTTLIGTFFCLLATIAAFLIFIFKTKIGANCLGVLFMINLTIPVIVITTLFFAKINLKMFIEQSHPV